MTQVSFPDPASPEGQRWAAAGFPVDGGVPQIPAAPEPPKSAAEPAPESLYDVLRELIFYGARPSRRDLLAAAVDRAQQAATPLVLTGDTATVTAGPPPFPVFGQQ